VQIKDVFKTARGLLQLLINAMAEMDTLQNADTLSCTEEQQIQT